MLPSTGVSGAAAAVVVVAVVVEEGIFVTHMARQ